MNSVAPPTIDKLFRLFNQEYATLSPQLKAIGHYIERNKHSIMLIRIKELAEACDVHPSAVIRFTQRFGFTGFAQFKELFKKEFIHLSGQDDTPPTPVVSKAPSKIDKVIKESLHSLTRLQHFYDEAEFSRAVRTIREATSVYMLGDASAYPVASYLSLIMADAGKKVFFIEQSRSNLPQFWHADDVLLVFDLAPFNNRQPNCLAGAMIKPRLIVLTDDPDSPLCAEADSVLLIEPTVVKKSRSFLSAFCLCQALQVSMQEPAAA
ncbi:MurR/RpiR family transcriptional regulator [Leeia oryzae]|uniref:MurR/RpiR family transcriptional regulator n=1 Tax=Leeia oryzae TaxID=356662 RepID=UPI00037CF7BD|nr:MurR/RpiR family transcriptional regulator [Leeia oryzae]